MKRTLVIIIVALGLAACAKDHAPDKTASPGYLDYSQRDDALSGGVKMIPIDTPKGKFHVWTKQVGNNAEFITYERLCCPFFDLELVLEREGGPAWLRLRGREGVKAFIRSEFGIK